MMHQKIDLEAVRDTNRASRWCILRTSGPSTGRLAASLQNAGIEAWTPTEHIQRRMPRGKSKESRIVAMAPTYVFVRWTHEDELRLIERAEITPHPRFSIFRHCGKTVYVSHRALHQLRALQQDSYIASLPYSGRRPGKPRGKHYEPGETVKITNGAFTGFEAHVDASDGLTTTLVIGLFGRPTEVRVPTLHLRSLHVPKLATAA